MNIKEIKDIALANVDEPDLAASYRRICRWYSKTFHTPLHEVFNLPPNDVLLAYFEEGYEQMDEEDLALDVMRTVNPDYDQDEEENLKEYIEALEAQEYNAQVDKNQKPKSVTKTYNEEIPDDETPSGLEDL